MLEEKVAPASPSSNVEGLVTEKKSRLGGCRERCGARDPAIHAIRIYVQHRRSSTLTCHFKYRQKMTC